MSNYVLGDGDITRPVLKRAVAMRAMGDSWATICQYLAADSASLKKAYARLTDSERAAMLGR